MDIEYKVIATDNLLAMRSFKRTCLDCKECTGLCRQFFELCSLPETVLNVAERPS